MGGDKNWVHCLLSLNCRVWKIDAIARKPRYVLYRCEKHCS